MLTVGNILKAFDSSGHPTVHILEGGNIDDDPNPLTTRLLDQDFLVMETLARVQRDSHGALVVGQQGAIGSIKPVTAAEPFLRVS
jgi:hypothetical protein